MYFTEYLFQEIEDNIMILPLNPQLNQRKLGLKNEMIEYILKHIPCKKSKEFNAIL